MLITILYVRAGLPSDCHKYNQCHFNIKNVSIQQRIYNGGRRACLQNDKMSYTTEQNAALHRLPANNQQKTRAHVRITRPTERKGATVSDATFLQQNETGIQVK